MSSGLVRLVEDADSMTSWAGFSRDHRSKRLNRGENAHKATAMEIYDDPRKLGIVHETPILLLFGKERLSLFFPYPYSAASPTSFNSRNRRSYDLVHQPLAPRGSVVHSKQKIPSGR